MFLWVLPFFFRRTNFLGLSEKLGSPVSNQPGRVPNTTKVRWKSSRKVRRNYSWRGTIHQAAAQGGKLALHSQNKHFSVSAFSSRLWRIDLKGAERLDTSGEYDSGCAAQAQNTLLIPLGERVTTYSFTSSLAVSIQGTTPISTASSVFFL